MKVTRWGAVLCAAVLFSGVFASSTKAADKFRLWLQPDPAEFKFVGDAGVTFFGEDKINNEDEAVSRGDDWEWQQQQADVDAIIPLWKNGSNELFVEMDFTGMHIDTDARLPRWDNDPFPSQLIDTGLGLTLKHYCENGWMVGGNIRLGSASDKPFHSEDELTASFTGWLRIPHKEHNAWMFFLDVRNNHANGSLNYLPKPGVGYQFAWSKTDWAVIGAPVMAVHWEPMPERLKLDAMYMIPRTAHAKLTYVPSVPSFEFYGAFDMDSQVFWRHDREDKEDGLVLMDKRASAGLVFKPTENITLDGSLGYAWDRRVYEAEKYDQRDKNRLDIDDGLFGMLKIEVTF